MFGAQHIKCGFLSIFLSICPKMTSILPNPNRRVQQSQGGASADGKRESGPESGKPPASSASARSCAQDAGVWWRYTYRARMARRPTAYGSTQLLHPLAGEGRDRHHLDADGGLFGPGDGDVAAFDEVDLGQEDQRLGP